MLGESGKDVWLLDERDALLAGAERLRLCSPDGRGVALFRMHQRAEGNYTRSRTTVSSCAKQKRFTRAGIQLQSRVRCVTSVLGRESVGIRSAW